MKTTVFTKYHIAAGAKMAEFAGYNMPIEFTGINDEHMAVRNGAGVFDVSHMGEIWVKGPRALDLLQRITTNDVSKLFDGKVQYTCMPNGRGGIVDDILVYRVDAETYMLCVNAANIDKDWKHICAEGKAFGMEAGHYDLSVAVASHSLLPTLDAQPDAVYLADGFSCRTQAAQLTGRGGVHLATLLAGYSG